ncbi:MAG: hypothetical protein ACTHK2_11240 [Dokdonella sp.]|uniref:hypothetical protein n=1 Tax=Dokdonella sp. TaxID=2291710 RepID=UPI003F81E7EA
MPMRHRLMAMVVGVGFRSIPREIVLMLMVIVGHVPMRVLERFVRMPFADVQPHTEGH